jgi:hypothetical protein
VKAKSTFCAGLWRRSPLFGIAAGLLALALAHNAAARITSITILDTYQPYGTVSFGSVGQYQEVDGVATGALDPRDPLNAIITDLDLAPQVNGVIPYSLTFSILMPVDLSNSNRTLLYDIVNRGNKVITGWNSVLPASPTPPAYGDGFLENEGFIIVWSGWESDLIQLPTPTGTPIARIQLLNTPIAVNRNGSAITGRVAEEYDLTADTTVVPLGSNPMVGNNGAASPPVTLNNSDAMLTERVHQTDPKVPIPNSQWYFAQCTQAQFPTVVNITSQVCVNMQTGFEFDTNHIYELTYTATQPPVAGIGLAAMRDFISFLRYGSPGVQNPLQGQTDHALMHGTSQSGRMARTFLDLGFNEDENHRRVVDGMNPHIGSIRIEINTRFAGVSHGPGLQHEEKLSTANDDPPVSYGDSYDPITGIQGGLLDRCRQSDTCPKIIHTNSDVEYWQGGMSLDTTEAGQNDLDIPDLVRIFHFSSTQHAGFSPGAALPTSPGTTTGICQYWPNANPYVYQQRALLIDLQDWVANGAAPPRSRYAMLSDGTLRQPSNVGYPNMVFPTGSPASADPTVVFTGLYNQRNLLDWGQQFDRYDESGIKSIVPPDVGSEVYNILEPVVDSDGNDIDGIRSHILQAPLGTYMGWNYRAANFGEGDLCDLTGSYIPFAVTKAQRSASGDSRASLQERYGNTAGYVAAVTAAVNSLVSQRLMLASDAAGAISNATVWFTQASGGMLP